MLLTIKHKIGDFVWVYVNEPHVNAVVKGEVVYWHALGNRNGVSLIYGVASGLDGYECSYDCVHTTEADAVAWAKEQFV